MTYELEDDDRFDEEFEEFLREREERDEEELEEILADIREREEREVEEEPEGRNPLYYVAGKPIYESKGWSEEDEKRSRRDMIHSFKDALWGTDLPGLYSGAW